MFLKVFYSPTLKPHQGKVSEDESFSVCCSTAFWTCQQFIFAWLKPKSVKASDSSLGVQVAALGCKELKLFVNGCTHSGRQQIFMYSIFKVLSSRGLQNTACKHPKPDFGNCCCSWPRHHDFDSLGKKR